MKVFLGILTAVVFFGLGWFAHEYRTSLPIPFLQYLPSSQEEENMVPPAENDENMTVCIQVITPATNPETGEIREFPTPCDVPEGWEVIQNDIPSLNEELDLI